MTRTTTIPIDIGQQARRQAEALADAALREAQARAASIMAAAAARASALCGSIERRAADGVIPAAGAASALVPTSSADAGPAAAQDVARRAYFKAERRGFVPGHETDDWLEAERELTAPAACTDVTAGLQPAGDA